MSNRLLKVRDRRIQRTARTRTKLHGTADKPRLSVHISNLHVSAQVIDDDKSVTICAASTVGNKKLSSNMTERAAAIGTEIADLCAKAKIKTAVLDRGPKKYHGRVKALADAAREKGLVL